MTIRGDRGEWGETEGCWEEELPRCELQRQPSDHVTCIVFIINFNNILSFSFVEMLQYTTSCVIFLMKIWTWINSCLYNRVWVRRDVSQVTKVVQHTFPAVFEHAKARDIVIIVDCDS